MIKSLIPLLILICLSIAFCACNTRAVEYEIIPLHHGLGELRLRKSPFFDTLYQWTHELDCDCCHTRKTRWSSQDFPLLQETGWKYAQPDSMQNLTIMQPEKAGCDPDFKLDRAGLRNEMKYVNNLYGSGHQWMYHQFETFDGHLFMVLGWEISQYGRYNNLNVQRLIAITVIDGEKVTLDFSCQRQDCGNFLRRSHWLLERMKIVDSR